MIGAYGPWADAMRPVKPGPLSLQNCPASEFAARRAAARTRVLECMAPPPRPAPVTPTVHRRWEHDGLEIEELSWPQPAGAPTAAWVLKPKGATGPLPGVLALHDHGGFKFYGKEKIAQVDARVHPLVAQHCADYYGGKAWANELARRGFVVLVHDAFAFGSRRVRLADVPELLHGDVKDDADDSPAGIDAYNLWTGMHEHVMAKSLFCAGTTWPGVFVTEDQMALDVLCARPDVDPARIGIGGLSGGGLRTVFLGGLDERVKCAVCVGMMTTWRDALLYKSYTPYLDVLCAAAAARTRLSGNLRAPCTAADHGAEHARRRTVHASGNGTCRTDAAPGLRLRRGAGPVQMLMVSRRAQVRPAHAGRGL